MFRIIEEFIKESTNNTMLKYTGALSGICGIFLAIPKSTIPNAEIYLAVVQFFWLIIFTLMLGSLFIKFIRFVIKKEKDILSSYNEPVDYTISAFIGLILLIVICSLWIYLLSVYTAIFVLSIIYIIIPVLIIIGVIIISIHLKRIEKKIPLYLLLLLYSFIIAVACSYFGFLIQSAITKLFYFYWFYPLFLIFWALLFLICIIFAVCKKRNIFKPYY